MAIRKYYEPLKTVKTAKPVNGYRFGQCRVVQTAYKKVNKQFNFVYACDSVTNLYSLKVLSYIDKYKTVISYDDFFKNVDLNTFVKVLRYFPTQKSIFYRSLLPGNRMILIAVKGDIEYYFTETNY